MTSICLRTASIAAVIALLVPFAASAQDGTTPRPAAPGAVEVIDQNQSPAAERKAAESKPESETLVARIVQRKLDYGEWVAAQVFLVICGLLAALIALALVPKTTTLAVAAIDSEPARAAVVGFMGLSALGVINFINSILFGTIIWIPFGTMVALASTVTFLFSGLLGVAYFGGILQKRRRPGVRGFFSRAVIGLVAIALFNCVPGVNLASFFLQMIAFVLGLGGILITGFGRDPDWLSKRLSSAGREWRD